MYIYGGKNDKTTFSDIHVFNLKNLQWEEQPKLTGDELSPRAFHQSIIFNNRPIMFTIGGNDDTRTAHLVNLETFSVKAVKIAGNVIPSLSSFTLSITQDDDLIIIGGKSKAHPTNIVQILHVPESEKKNDDLKLNLNVNIRKKMNSVICTPVSADDTDTIDYVLESQDNLLNNNEDENEYEYDIDKEAKPEEKENKGNQQQFIENKPENKKEATDKSHKSHRHSSKFLSVSKDDFSLPTFVNVLLFALPALAVFFVAFCSLSKFVLIGTLICVVFTGLIVLFRKYLIKEKERVLENVLCNEIKSNDGYANKVAFLLKYNVPSCVLKEFMKKNEQTKRFVFTTKTVDESTFDAIELAK